MGVLCLDEFQVVDVADAMLLRSLLTRMLEKNIHFVITSNRAPHELYLNGIQRASFLPCIDLLERRLEVVPLIGEHDYRQHIRGGVPELHILECPINDETSAWMERVFRRLAKGASISSRTLSTHGRDITVQRCAGNVALFTFSELCGSATSAADYLMIASTFPILIITDIPILKFEHRDEACRFITLVDILYDNRNRLVMQMAAPLANLFQLDASFESPHSGSLRSLADELSIPSTDLSKTSLATGKEEIFATHRTLSRLRQMQNADWWAMEPEAGKLLRRDKR